MTFSEEKDQEAYIALAKADVIFDGEVSSALLHFGQANLSVCPECKVDDFCHVEGCATGDFVSGQV